MFRINKNMNTEVLERRSTMLQVEQINTSQMMTIRESAKNQPTGRGTTPFEQMRRAAAEKANGQSEAEWFASRLHENLDSIQFDHSVVNGAVDITPEGLEAMRTDSIYCDQVMSLIRKEFSSSYSPRQVSIHISVGATLDAYRVDTWTASNDAEFRRISADSFYSRMGHVGAASPAEFMSGFLHQLRAQFSAAKEEVKAHHTTANENRISRAALQYEADTTAFSIYSAYRMHAYEG